MQSSRFSLADAEFVTCHIFLIFQLTLVFSFVAGLAYDLFQPTVVDFVWGTCRVRGFR
jgi:hypothetical protein